ncbi:M48 family metalloprotease [Arthrobacter sp. fls2-241-R2A-172]|uniref:M48 family metalloprotease n=1 Tax=Arthrobacter sp. fls2-241-R2A-172 TaxID=3040325 RepID=UPI00254A878D|nr:M48 family metalloprotease [Arthrobacter sp. fls2-241-R2A-172]
MNRATVDRQAREIAFPILESLCNARGCRVPDLHIVECLPGGSMTTARASRVQGSGTIEIPASLVLSLSRPALSYLLGHELGHIVLKRSFAVLLRRAVWALFWVFGLIPFACVAAAISGGGPEIFLIGVGSVLMTVPVIAVVTALLRKHEADCDLFSVRLEGNLAGALEHLGNHAAAAERKKPQTLWVRMLAHHPSDVRRMELLLRHARKAGYPNRSRN